MLPTSCSLCGQRLDAGSGLCPGCLADLPRPDAACDSCALPLARPGLCGGCLQDPPPVAGVVAPLVYGFPVDRLIGALKFRVGLELARPLSALVCEAARTRPRPDLLVPVPLHPARLRERGYNQASVLARGIGRLLDLPVSDYVVTRSVHNTPQAGLDAITRRRNVRGGFRVSYALSGVRIALIDDVLTTGATIWELARTLRQAGAADIEAWVCARTPAPP